MELALRCPEQFRLRYVDRVPEMSSYFLLSGSAVHATLEVALKRIFHGAKLPEAKELDDVFLSDWAKREEEEEGKMDFLGWESNPQAPDEIKEECRRLLPYVRENILPSLRPKVVEDDFKKTFPSEEGEFLVWGKLDLLEETSLITDWKTTTKVSANAAKSWLQNSYYSFFVADAGGDPSVVVETRKVFLIRGRIPRHESITHWIGAGHRAWFARAAARGWELYRRGGYVPNDNGWWCDERYCSFYQMCRGGYPR